jgi:1-acyl-sn-glycerol-3-phosphate acyltransferase
VSAPVRGTRPPLFHRLVSWIARRCLRWYYREGTVVGAERVPSTGPLLLIGNHPNDLPDVLFGYVTTRRPLRYVATISAATNPLARWVYRGLGVVPVARARDVRKMRALGIDIATMNREAARALRDALASGDAVGVFPEGGVSDTPELGPMRTGVARMVLDAHDAGAIDDLTIVPFGVQYEAPRRWGSDVLVVGGEPWTLAGWRAEVTAGGGTPSAVALAERMRAALRTVTRNSATWEAAEVRDVCLAATAAATAPVGALHQVAAQLAGRAWPTDAADPAAQEPLRLGALVTRAGGIATSARDHARLLHAAGAAADAALPPWWRIVLWTPAALAGWLVHAPLFRLVAAVADRGKTCRTDHVIRRFVPGVYVVVGWYLLVGVALLVAADTAGVDPLWGVPGFLALPRLGDAAVAWREWVRGRRYVRRCAAAVTRSQRPQ